jgi:TolA-binding protein
VFQTGDQATAKKLFTELTGPGNSAEWVSRGLAGLAWSQLKAEDLVASAATFEKLLNEHPDDPLAATAAQARGLALEKLGQTEAALVMYRRVIESYPQSRELPTSMFRAALLHDQLHQIDDARSLYQKLVEKHPAFAGRAAVLYQWGCLEADSRNSKEAVGLWQRVRDEHGTSDVGSDATYRLAVSALETGKLDECEKLLGELIGAPHSEHLQPHAFYLESRLAVAREQWAKVAAPLEKLISAFPDHALTPAAAYWIAEAAYRRGEYQAAEEKFAKVQLRSPGREDKWAPMASLRRAQSLAQLGKRTESLEIARQIEHDYPQFDSQFEVDYLIGRCLADDADFTAAREAYTKVIRSETGGKTETAAMAQWMIGESYFHQEDYAAALRAYLRVEILYAFPRWQAAALLQAAKCHEQLGEWKQATDAYSRLLKTYPSSEVAEEASHRLGVAEKKRTAQTSTN